MNAVFKTPDSDAIMFKFWGGNSPHVPQWQKFLLKLLTPMQQAALKRRLNLTDEQARAALVKTKDLAQEIAASLADGRKFLLATDEPTYIDVAFAALAAPLVLPDNYGGTKMVDDNMRIKMKVLPDDVRKEVEAFRKTEAGKFVIKMYENYR